MGGSHCLIAAKSGKKESEGISHLIPRAQRLTLVNTMIMPLFDYGDTVLGDRKNKCLMKIL